MAGSNSKRDLPRYVRLIEVGLFDAKTLVTSIFSLDHVRDAFQAAADRTTVASVITFT
jgi:Zn-dependent alcohol dehydrogenase